MAAPALRTAAWAGAAALAATGLAALALHGERPEAGLSRFQPAGVMLALPPERVTAVELSRAGRRWRFERRGEGWAVAPGTPAPAADLAPRLALGLKLLHGSAPQRVMEGEEVRALSLAEAGLAPPALAVRVEAPGAPPFAVELGGRNPQGLARYARVAGRPEIFLLNAFVADPWLSLAEGP